MTNPSPQVAGTPAAEHEITSTLVRALLTEQHPDLASLPLHPLDAGWDNTMFRLGDDLCVRLPRRQAAAVLIEHEQRWLPHLANRLTLPVPTPCRFGKPSRAYPWSWSVTPWLQGATADVQPPLETQAKPFAQFLCALHTSAPVNAPVNEVRGVPLPQRAAGIAARMQRLSAQTDLITPEITLVWKRALNATASTEANWLHGDLHPRNILVNDGVISGIIDWGDLTAGDVATDLAALWMLFAAAETRAQALTEYGDITEATLQRARGWAVLFGVVLLDTGLVDHPAHAAIGANTLRRVAAF